MPPSCQHVLCDSYLKNKRGRLNLLSSSLFQLPWPLTWVTEMSLLPHQSSCCIPSDFFLRSQSDLKQRSDHVCFCFSDPCSGCSVILVTWVKATALTLACKARQGPAPLYLSELISDHSPASRCHSSPSGVPCPECAGLTPASGRLLLLPPVLQQSPFVRPPGFLANPLRGKVILVRWGLPWL